MFTHVFDEMQRGFFDEEYFPCVRLDRLMAHECYELAVEAMTLIVQGFTIEYADIECSDYRDWVVVARTMFELSRTIEYANKALMRLRHDEKWDRYVKADKLEQQARNLWEVARALSQLRRGVGE
jgi:hypothetical protein